MNALIPADTDAASTASVDGYTYTVRVLHEGHGYRALLSWQHRKGEQSTPVFSNSRSAVIEAHALAEEWIVAWRR